MEFAYDVGRARLSTVSGRSLSTAPTSTIGKKVNQDRLIMTSMTSLFPVTYVVIVE